MAELLLVELPIVELFSVISSPTFDSLLAAQTGLAVIEVGPDKAHLSSGPFDRMMHACRAEE